MGNYGDDRGGGERWQGRESNWNRDRDYGREQGRDSYGGHGGPGRGDDRGFLDRAGDELRSWFGDDDAQHRREMDQRRWEQEQRMTGRRGNDYGRSARDDYGRDDHGAGTLGGGGFGTGWGNQAAESWNRERPGARGWYGADADRERGGGAERHYARGEREGWFSDSRGGERGERHGGSGGYGSAAGSRSAGSGHDPHYSEWRRRQIEDLDRDYDEWRREHQSRFEQEFASWRTKRQSQRGAVARVTEHMEVVGSDGSHVGTVDKVRDGRIVLAKSDPAAGGIHHSVPCSWIETVEDKVRLNKSAEEAKAGWRDEERNPALFERGEGSDGPHNLDRAFSGTYQDRGSEGRRD